MKVQASRELLKANLFLSPKKLNRRQSLHEIFLSAKIFSAYTSTLYFKMNMSTLFCCSLFFKVYDNPQVTINKSKQSVNYSLIPSGITSRTEPLIFLQIPYCSLSLSVSVCLPLSLIFFFEFLSNLCMPPWFRNIFKFVVFRLLENVCVGQKIESRYFYSCTLAFMHSYS